MTTEAWRAGGGLLALVLALLVVSCFPPAGGGEPRIDADGDGFVEGEDCDDSDPFVHPEAIEHCGDGVDEDCSGVIDDGFLDADGDGAVSELCVDGDDCDDEQPYVVSPGEEIPYDGIDQDCDGSDLVDVDGDGHDAAVAGGGDCDDEDVQTHPGAEEGCSDGVDRDCDGWIDDYDEDCCALDCACEDEVWVAGLSCGSGEQSCSVNYDSAGRPYQVSCTYANGPDYSCHLDYSTYGNLASIWCTTDYAEGGSCHADC